MKGENVILRRRTYVGNWEKWPAVRLWRVVYGDKSMMVLKRGKPHGFGIETHLMEIFIGAMRTESDRATASGTGLMASVLGGVAKR